MTVLRRVFVTPINRLLSNTYFLRICAGLHKRISDLAFLGTTAILDHGVIWTALAVMLAIVVVAVFCVFFETRGET